MFKVYWTLVNDQREKEHCAFETTLLTEALTFSENLRRQRREGAQISHIVMSSENPDSVGQQGVNDILPEGYDWKKRRI